MQEIAGVLRNKTDKSITLMPEKPFFSLIWLHGLGDSSEGFLSFFQMQQSPVSHGARIRLLNAPLRKVTINYGVKSTAGMTSSTCHPMPMPQTGSTWSKLERAWQLSRTKYKAKLLFGAKREFRVVMKYLVKGFL